MLTVLDIQHTVLTEHHTLAFQSAGNPALLTLLLWEPWDLPGLKKHHYIVAGKLAENMDTQGSIYCQNLGETCRILLGAILVT
jgi:hypothetical protein